MSAHTLAKFLRDRMEELALTNSDVARRANISRQTWYRLLNADIDEARLNTLEKIANALDTHVMSLLRLHFTQHKSTQSQQGTEKDQLDINGYVEHMTHPNHSTVYAGETFTKIWRLTNISEDIWENLCLECDDDKKGQEDTLYLKSRYSKVLLPKTSPGQSVDIPVTFKAPQHACTATSKWKATNEGKVIKEADFGSLRCLVEVVTLQ